MVRKSVREDRRCTIDGCDVREFARGWCRRHWDRWRSKGDPLAEPDRIVGDDLARVCSRVEVTGVGCWEWTAGRDQHGYGRVNIGGSITGAHRAMWGLLVGPIPQGLELDHLCRNPPCVNPDHLEPVTHAENLRRSPTGWNTRLKTHCPQGHPYDEENTFMNRAGSRVCRICRREARRRHENKRRDHTKFSAP